MVLIDDYTVTLALVSTPSLQSNIFWRAGAVTTVTRSNLCVQYQHVSGGESHWCQVSTPVHCQWSGWTQHETRCSPVSHSVISPGHTWWQSGEPRCSSWGGAGAAQDIPAPASLPRSGLSSELEPAHHHEQRCQLLNQGYYHGELFQLYHHLHSFPKCSTRCLTDFTSF